MTRSTFIAVIGLLCSAMAAPALAQTQDDPVRLEGSTIRGDQELPIGLYITPWRDSEPEQGIDKPARLLDEALVPIDPDAFRRQMLYWQALEAARPKPAGDGVE